MATRGTTLRALLVLAALLLTACSPETEDESPSHSTATTGSSASPTSTPFTLDVTPAAGATAVLISTEAVVTTNGVLSAVTLAGPGGAAVKGTFRADGRTWVPATQLAYGTRYTLTATAVRDGSPKTVTSTFTTMAAPAAGRLNGADPYVFDGDVVGVAMPVAVEFTKRIPIAQRASVERRLFVASSPQVEGSWHWWTNSEVHFRPKQHWTPGTKVSVRLAIGGLPMGSGLYGKRDRFVRFTVGDQVTTKVDGAAHVARVYRNGALVRTMPASLGKTSSPTSSGLHVVMEKREAMTFDSGTFGVPADSAGGYRQKVYWDVRFTWGGEFFHSAPWSVGSQGRRNVSHGCVNLSPANARWYFDYVKKGDPVEIVNTGRTVSPGDGWTDWNVPWETFVKASALHAAGQSPSLTTPLL